MDPSRKRLMIGLGLAIAVVLIFLAGYLPGRSRAHRAAEETRQAARQLDEARQTLALSQFDLEVARLRGTLGEVLYHANGNNFGVAAEQASRFFDGVRRAVASPHLAPASDRRTILQSVLARRDEISADLARADPAVKGKLAEVYMTFGQAVE